jgi:tellurite methyltransferase
MSEADRQKWDQKYAEGAYQARTWPSGLLEAWLDKFPPGRALDIGCGSGRNALRIAEAGYQVDALDISNVALERGRNSARERGLEINFQQTDLDTLELEPNQYQLITIIRYVNRQITQTIVNALAPGGWLLFEHHLRTPIDVDGPRSPSFRLAPQEPLAMFSELRILHYQEAIKVERDERPMAIVELIGCKGDPGY